MEDIECNANCGVFQVLLAGIVVWVELGFVDISNEL